MTVSPPADGGTRPARWEPDSQLVPALLAGGGRAMADLDPADRSWAVAGLLAAGLTAEEVAERLRCSLRSVRAVRAEPMTQVCLLAQEETGHFRDELRLVRTELRSATVELTQARTEARQLRAQVVRMVLAAGPPRCVNDHPQDKVNTYVHPATGKRYCRVCHADRQRTRRRGTQALQGQPAPA